MPSASPVRADDSRGSGRAHLPGAQDPSAAVTAIAIPTRLLVIGLEQPDGRVHQQHLYDIAASLAMSDQQVRLCVRRLIAQGYYVQHGRGREAVLHGTDKPRMLALPETAWGKMIRAQDAGLVTWDGSWRLYILTVPETVRQIRDQVRTRLSQLGAALLTGGVHVSPHDLSDELASLLDELDAHRYLATATTTDLSVAGSSNRLDLTRDLWPVEALGDQYRRLQEDTLDPLLQHLEAHPDLSADAAVVILLRVLVHVGQVMQGDPLLPPELLPHPWAGTRARTAADLLGEHLQVRLGPQAPAALRLLLA